MRLDFTEAYKRMRSCNKDNVNKALVVSEDPGSRNSCISYNNLDSTHINKNGFTKWWMNARGLAVTSSTNATDILKKR